MDLKKNKSKKKTNIQGIKNIVRHHEQTFLKISTRISEHHLKHTSWFTNIKKYGVYRTLIAICDSVFTLHNESLKNNRHFCTQK